MECMYGKGELYAYKIEIHTTSRCKKIASPLTLKCDHSMYNCMA